MKTDQLIQIIVIGGMLSILLLPTDEIYFPLSRYAMFASERPDLEPLPFVEVELLSGTVQRVPAGVWNRGGVSSARNQLQYLLRREHSEQLEFCQHLVDEVSRWLNLKSEEGTVVRISGGQFDRKSVFRPEALRPLHSKVILECPVRSKEN